MNTYTNCSAAISIIVSMWSSKHERVLKEIIMLLNIIVPVERSHEVLFILAEIEGCVENTMYSQDHSHLMILVYSLSFIYKDLPFVQLGADKIYQLKL